MCVYYKLYLVGIFLGPLKIGASVNYTPNTFNNCATGYNLRRKTYNIIVINWLLIIIFIENTKYLKKEIILLLHVPLLLVKITLVELINVLKNIPDFQMDIVIAQKLSEYWTLQSEIALIVYDRTSRLLDKKLLTDRKN